MIPGALATGTVTIRCRVFDQAAPDAGSRSFTRTLVFAPVEPVNLFLVGIQTQRPAAPAPTQSAVAAALALLRKTYPRSGVQVTGFTTATLASQIVGLTSNSGCGKGWSDLLDILRDLRGGSGDLYFGGLPPGIFAAGVIGCSPTGERIAASFIDLPTTVPHEVGHALGRRHAPCRACSPPAQDPDPNFPQYNTFNSDSIGVFGFDPTTNQVFNPATSLDFMTAFLSGTEWISPYTHQALLGPIQGGPAAPGAMTQLGGLRETLFLYMEISRDRAVSLRVSFHYPAPPQGGTGCDTRFSYEFHDRHREVLDCGPLHCPCAESRCGCWPVRIRDAVPLPPSAHWLVIYEDEEPIHEAAIGDPPTVRIAEPYDITDDGVRVRWSSDAEDVWYLVHVEDPAQGIYRGLAPRTQDDSIVVPRRLFTHGPRLRVRVLACSGMATGTAEAELQLPRSEPSEVSITLLDLESVAQLPADLPAVITAHAVDSSGRQVPPDDLAWYDEPGNLVARGAQLDLRTIGPDRRLLRVVARGHLGRTAGRNFLVESQAGRHLLHSEFADPPRASRPAQPHQHPHPAPRD
jgi:hypothetical protein